MPETTGSPELPKLEINIDQLSAELATLAQISEAEPPIVTRVVFSEADRRARTYIKDLARAAGLTHLAGATGSTSEAAVARLYGLPDAARDALFQKANQLLPVAHVGEASELAETYLYFMRSGFVTGSIAYVDGGAGVMAAY